MFDGLPPVGRVRGAASPVLDPTDPINRGLRGFWPLDEAAGPGRDLSPWGNDLLPVVSPATLAGRVGRMRYFNGSTQYLRAAGFRWPSDSPAAVSLWVNTPGGTNGTPFDIGFGNTGANSAFYGHLPYSNNRAYFYYVNGGTGAIDVDFASYRNVWTHVVYATNGVDFKGVWLNGILISSSATTGGRISGERTGIDVGRYASLGGLFHNGALGLLRVFTRVPTSAEVLRLYADPWAGTVAPDDAPLAAVLRAALPPIAGDLSATFPAPSFTAAGALAIAGSLSATFPAPSFTASGVVVTAGIAASRTLVLPARSRGVTLSARDRALSLPARSRTVTLASERT